MGLRIATNVTSISAQRNLRQTTDRQGTVLQKLASGNRISRAADDSAGLAISEKMKAKVRGVNQAKRNANDGVSMIQTAEGGLNEVSNILIRLRELSVQSATDTVGDQERAFMDSEYQELKEEVDRISRTTEFNGKRLLDGGDDTYDFQIGINNIAFEDRISYEQSESDASLDSLFEGDESGMTVSTKELAQEGLAKLDAAIQNVSGQRAVMGSIQNRLGSTINNLEVSAENVAAANSRIRDTDYASATAENTKLSILNSAGSAVLAQANSNGQSALRLIG
jgi:flagellin